MRYVTIEEVLRINEGVLGTEPWKAKQRVFRAALAGLCGKFPSCDALVSSTAPGQACSAVTTARDELQV
jgi:hypothetical protein